MLVDSTKLIVRKISFVWRTRGVRATVRTIYRELLKQLLVRVFGLQYIKTNIFDFKLLLDLQDRGISRTLWLFGERELDHKWIMEKTLKPGAKVLDIGANIGYYVLIESGLAGKSGHIVAVEPAPGNLAIFHQNISLNRLKQVTVVEGAVSNIGGVQEFWIAEESNLNTFRKDILENRGTLREGINVKVFTVQELTKTFGPFDYLRMDIEGHEVQVLQDIVQMGRNGEKCPDIIFETHINTYAKFNGDDSIGTVLRELKKLGYVVGFVGSSTERGTKILEELGYKSIKIMRTDETVRTIHQNIQFDQLINCLEKTGGIRTVYLTQNSHNIG